MNGVGTGEEVTAGMFQSVDSNVCLSGCSIHDDGYMVNGSIAMAAC